MTLTTGTKLGRYEIRSKVGEGGMGEVYLALDTKLGRKVALKILPAELASNQDRMHRFTQEAKAAAALNHPNIAHIYEIGDHDGISFIAMAAVTGLSPAATSAHPSSAGCSRMILFRESIVSLPSKAFRPHKIHVRDNLQLRAFAGRKAVRHRPRDLLVGYYSDQGFPVRELRDSPNAFKPSPG